MLGLVIGGRSFIGNIVKPERVIFRRNVFLGFVRMVKMLKMTLKCLAAIAIAITWCGQSLASADCSSKDVGQLGGEYVGQALGFRSQVTLHPNSSGGCRFNAEWQIFRNADETEAGRMQLKLAQDELHGQWSNGTDSGTVRFAVRRQGQHLNGRIEGIKGEPDGPWDLIKVVDKR